MAQNIQIRAKILDKMLQHARREPETECCGLLAGRGGVVTAIFPTRNALDSPTVYEIAPLELFRLFREMREEGLEHLGQYHSHLNTENFPSPRDIELACYPETAYFIVSPRADTTNPIRAFFIREGNVQELEIVVAQS